MSEKGVRKRVTTNVHDSFFITDMFATDGIFAPIENCLPRAALEPRIKLLIRVERDALDAAASKPLVQCHVMRGIASLVRSMPL